MSIQITCHKCPADNLTKKLLTIRVFIHFDDEVAERQIIDTHSVISQEERGEIYTPAHSRP